MNSKGQHLSSKETLKKYWGYDSFRPPQEEIIRSVLDNKNTLALLPTGGGKSICFQVPGLMKEGLTLVISPLIALMKDQVNNLNRRRIPATSISSSLTFKQIDEKFQNAIRGDYKFLYISPERLGTEMFLLRADKLNINLIAIDEAHCISQWGFDFRPSYLNIGKLRELFPKVPVIALTATATPEVQKDILEVLQIEDARVFRKSFRRKNLFFEIVKTDNNLGEIIRYIKQSPGSGIVYSRTRKRTEKIAKLLQENGISSTFYHGGLDPNQRISIQDDWISGKCRVISTTNAFGMGIDKGDVRFVMHYNLPSDIESYYQEAGRAGRDGKPARALAFNNESDIRELQNWVALKYPDWELFHKHYIALMQTFRIPNMAPPTQSFPFDIQEISRNFKFSSLKFYNSLKIMHEEGLIYLDENKSNYASLKFIIGPKYLPDFKYRNPNKAELINLGLRLLGGDVYNNFHRFLPSRWAKILGMKENEVLEDLNFLKERKVIFFQPPSNTPKISFLRGRTKLSRGVLNWHKYHFLKKQGEARLESFLGYVQSESNCRSVILQEYFGEKTTDDCGFCDVCRAKASKQGNPYTVAKQQLSKILTDNSLSFENLLFHSSFEISGKKEVIIRRLIDEGWLEVNADQKIQLTVNKNGK